MPRQLWGPNEIAFLGSTFDGSVGVHIRMTVLENTCNHNSVDHIRYYWWGQNSMPVVGIKCGVGSADQVICWCKPEVNTIWCWDLEVSHVYLYIFSKWTFYVAVCSESFRFADIKTTHFVTVFLTINLIFHSRMNGDVKDKVIALGKKLWSSPFIGVNRNDVLYLPMPSMIQGILNYVTRL